MKSSDRGYFTSHSECYDDDFYVSDQRFYELNYPEGANLLDVNEPNNSNSRGRFPKSVFFIIGNEFCERFSYYGLRAVLTLYLTSVLKFDEHGAIELFHGFIFLCYFMPVFGAILADGFIGKFRTILYISIIYAAGNLMLAAAATGPLNLPMKEFSILGLVLIAIGTGGIKPCVSAFGGDQFNSGEDSLLEKFFSVFYFSINAGSLLSMFITPRLRANIHCFGAENCFPLAFGVPAVLMVISLVLFIIGKPWYRVNPANGTVITDFGKCIYHGVKRALGSKQKKEHWLDHAEGRFDEEFIESTKAVLRILVLFIPIPFFWALFDQMGSRWILQATHLDGRIPGTNFYLLPDQIGVLNPILILAFIPLFEVVVYPAFAKVGLLKKPLQKMCAGGFLAAFAYVVAGFLSIKLEAMAPVLPSGAHTQIRFINVAPCHIIIQSDFIQTNLTYGDFHLTGTDVMAGDYNITITSVNCSASEKRVTFLEHFDESTVYSVIIGQDMSTPENDFVLFSATDTMNKVATKGKALVSVSYVMPEPTPNLEFMLGGHEFRMPNVTEDYGSTAFEIIDPGSYKVSLDANVTSAKNIATVDVQTGAIIRIVVTSTCEYCDLKSLRLKVYTLVKPNTVHMAWQLPQYFIISAAEIMLSITGLQFSYSQAPEAMKSVLSAAWLLTVSFGNCIVLVMELIGTLPKPSQEYFMFASLMGFDMCIFIILAHFYKYVEPVEKHEPSEVEANTSL